VQGYYRSSAAVFLMFDVSETPTFKSIKNWLRDVNLNTHSCTTLVLVANKIDKVPRLISTEMAKSFAEESGMIYYETCGLSG